MRIIQFRNWSTRVAVIAVCSGLFYCNCKVEAQESRPDLTDEQTVRYLKNLYAEYGSITRFPFELWYERPYLWMKYRSTSTPADTPNYVTLAINLRDIDTARAIEKGLIEIRCQGNLHCAMEISTINGERDLSAPTIGYSLRWVGGHAERGARAINHLASSVRRRRIDPFGN